LPRACSSRECARPPPPLGLRAEQVIWCEVPQLPQFALIDIHINGAICDVDTRLGERYQPCPPEEARRANNQIPDVLLRVIDDEAVELAKSATRCPNRHARAWDAGDLYVRWRDELERRLHTLDDSKLAASLWSGSWKHRRKTLHD
jgi:hypothetical protein